MSTSLILTMIRLNTYAFATTEEGLRYCTDLLFRYTSGTLISFCKLD